MILTKPGVLQPLSETTKLTIRETTANTTQSLVEFHCDRARIQQFPIADKISGLNITPSFLNDINSSVSFEGGNNGSGMDTFMPAKAATQTFYSFARVTGLSGDGLYSVGELQLNGVAAVPEPETLALMLGGLGLLGLRLRRRNG